MNFLQLIVSEFHGTRHAARGPACSRSRSRDSVFALIFKLWIRVRHNQAAAARNVHRTFAITPPDPWSGARRRGRTLSVSAASPPLAQPSTGACGAAIITEIRESLRGEGSARLASVGADDRRA